jgi:hypothetical protein
MSRMPRAGGRYVAPIKQSDGTSPVEEGHGKYTLAANTTYVYPLGGADAPFQSVQLTGYTSAAVITTATIRDCNHHGGMNSGLPATQGDVPDTSTTVGEWIAEDPTTAFVGVDGTGWSVTNGVVAAAGSGVGGALFHVAETGAARTLLEVAVGATGGVFRASAHGKD